MFVYKVPECRATVAGHHWHIKCTSGTSIDLTSPITAVNVTNLFRSQVSLNVIFVFTQVLWSLIIITKHKNFIACKPNYMVE